MSWSWQKQQEPKITATVSQCPEWIYAFNHNKDVYATIASIALGVPYEECLEFKLDENGNKTSEVNPEGKARRSMGKVLNLGRLAWKWIQCEAFKYAACNETIRYVTSY